MPTERTERVEISCPISTHGAIQNKEIPHRVLVLAPISGQKQPKIEGAKAPPIRVTKSKRNDIKALMKQKKPTVGLRNVRNHFIPNATIDLTLVFNRMEDFTSKGIQEQLKEQIPQFKVALDELRKAELLLNQMDNTGRWDEFEDPKLRDVFTRHHRLVRRCFPTVL